MIDLLHCSAKPFFHTVIEYTFLARLKTLSAAKQRARVTTSIDSIFSVPRAVPRIYYLGRSILVSRGQTLYSRRAFIACSISARAINALHEYRVWPRETRSI